MKRELLSKDIRAYKNYEGAWVCFAIVRGFLEQHRYYGFTKSEALSDFYQRYNYAR